MATRKKRKPWSRTTTPADRRFPFRVCLVGLTSYVALEDVYGYHDACLFADVARAELGEHVIVWDTKEERVLYDSRKIAR